MRAHRERSRCPVAYCLDVLGDRWTLLIVRDLALKSRRYFGDFLNASEGISTKILTERLGRLERWGLVMKASDPADQRRARYFLTDDGLDLLPILIEMTVWGSRGRSEWDPAADLIEYLSPDRAGTIRRYRERHIADRERAQEEAKGP